MFSIKLKFKVKLELSFEFRQMFKVNCHVQVQVQALPYCPCSGICFELNSMFTLSKFSVNFQSPASGLLLSYRDRDECYL